MLFGFPMIAGAGSLAASAAGIYYATYVVRSQLLGPADWRGRKDTSSVALTFDDGPSEDTPRILDILRTHNVKAAFFMLGRQAERFPEIARNVAADGHEIGNHSYSHPIYLFRSRSETQQQLERAQAIISDVTGRKPLFARPPYGVRTPAYFAAARRLDLRTVQWDVDGSDWKDRTAAEIAAKILRDVTAGSIILLHDGDSALKRDRSATVGALPLIIGGLKTQGLNIVPLSQLLRPQRRGRLGARNSPMKPIVFVDFDGTITRGDAIDAILERFADRRWLEIEEEWKEGRIGSRDCLSAQMKLVRATKDEIDQLLDSIAIDEGFLTLLQTCAAHGVEAHILSDGFDYCIDRILSRSSLDLKLAGVRIFSSLLEHRFGNWHVDYPWFHQSCAHGCATCKPSIMRLLNQSARPAIFIGDGLSDRYAVGSADVVFAKDKLAAYCKRQQIDFYHFENLSEVAMKLNEMLAANFIVEREANQGVGA